MGLFEGFLHPALAWGAALAAVPLLIHLFNRQRHKPMDWAAMRFVLEAYRRTRRRTQLESLILLFLRMAAVALLALAIARPYIGRESALAPLTVESRRDLVLILDASASTGYRENVTSVFEAELERARELLARYDGTRGDRVRLVVAGSAPRLVSARSPEDALALLSTLTQPSDQKLDVNAALAAVAGFAEEDGGASDLEVRLLTDLQRDSFVATTLGENPAGAAAAAGSADEEGGADALLRTLDRLEELGLRVLVEDLGPSRSAPANLAVAEVEPIGTLLGPGLPTEIAVTVANHGASTKAGVRVALEVDGERLPSRSLDVDGRSNAQVVFPVTFQGSGHHVVEAHLEGDQLAVDDARARVVFVPPAVRVLLVDGDPADQIDRAETGYLRVVLEPADDGGLASGSFAPFDTETMTAADFGGSELELSEYDLIVLANVGVLSSRTVEALESRVAAGAAVLFTLGDRFADANSIEATNTRLVRADGTGLLPARLRNAIRLPSRRENYFRAAWFDGAHPALSFFEDERWRPFLTEVPVYGFVSSAPVDGARVLARLDDADESPLLLERPYDRGRVLLWTSSIDADWTRLPESPSSFIPLVHELLRHAARQALPTRNVSVGATVVAETAAFPRNPKVLAPDGSRTPLDGEPTELGEGLWRLPTIDDADRTGVWRIELDGEEDYAFAVGLEPGESDLLRLEPGELEGLHSVWRESAGSDGDGALDDERTPDRGELWRWLAGLCLAALVLETLWAAWIGRTRRLA